MRVQWAHWRWAVAAKAAMRFAVGAVCSARTLAAALKLSEQLAQPRVGLLRLGHAPRVEVVQPH